MRNQCLRPIGSLAATAAAFTVCRTASAHPGHDPSGHGAAPETIQHYLRSPEHVVPVLGAMAVLGLFLWIRSARWRTPPRQSVRVSSRRR